MLRETQVRSLGREDPVEKEMATHSVFLPGKNPMDRGAWGLQSMGSQRVGTQLSDLTFTFPFHALEKEMATHSSVLVNMPLVPWNSH